MGSVRGGQVHKEMRVLWNLPDEEERSSDMRGRDPELVALRNEHILYRYVWMCRVYPSRVYEWYIQQLKMEFYLSESTLGQMIEDSGTKLHLIRMEGKNNRQLREKYPSFSWGN
jgi:hypothetical protein